MTAAFNQMLAQGPTPIKFADPVNQMAQLMQLKNAQQTGVVNQMAIDKGQREITQKNALNAAYQGNIDPATGKINFPGLGQRLAAEGQGELLPDIQKAEQVFRTGEDTAAKARNDRIVGGLELTQNALSRIDPYSPNAGEQMKSIFSGAHKDPVLGAWLDSNGQTEAATHATVDDAVSKGTMPALYLQSMSSAKSIQDRIAKEGTPQSPVAKMQADLARLPPGSPERAALEAAITKAGTVSGTTIKLPPIETATGSALGKGYAERIMKESGTAQNSQNQINMANQILADVENSYTGADADIRLKGAKLAKAIGLDDVLGVGKDGKSIVATEDLGRLLAQTTLNGIAESNLGTGKSFTDKDLQFLKDVVGGSIKFDKDTIIRMANIQKNIAKEKHAAYRETYSRLKPEYQETVFNPSGNLADEPATAPVASGAAAPAPIQIKNNEEWAKLPVGQEFLDPNGVKRVKQ
jgi:hypothetical protein